VSVAFSPEAEIDCASVIEYLAERNKSAATALGHRIFAVIDKLARGDFEDPPVILQAGASTINDAAADCGSFACITRPARRSCVERCDGDLRTQAETDTGTANDTTDCS
jgi:hypothetical protein